MIEMKSLAGKEQKKMKINVVIYFGFSEKLFTTYFKKQVLKIDT